MEFPSLTVHCLPLTIRYLRPGPADPLSSYRGVVKQVDGASALFVPGPPGAYPSRIEFVSAGTDITRQGNYDESTLEAAARSIVERSR